MLSTWLRNRLLWRWKSLALLLSWPPNEKPVLMNDRQTYCMTLNQLATHLQFHDWLHLPTEDKFILRHHSGGDDFPESMLVNGQGPHQVAYRTLFSANDFKLCNCSFGFNLNFKYSIIWLSIVLLILPCHFSVTSDFLVYSFLFPALQHHINTWTDPLQKIQSHARWACVLTWPYDRLTTTIPVCDSFTFDHTECQMFQWS